MFVLTVEDCTFKCVPKFADGLLGDVIRDVGRMLGPELMAEVGDIGVWHGREAISLGPGS